MKSRSRHSLIVLVFAAILLAFSGCSTVGSAGADLGLAGAGGVAGYHLSDGKVGGAAAGAAVGYVASRVAQAEVRSAMSDAERRGYAKQIQEAIARDGFFVRVPAGKQFYLYATETIDVAKGTRGNIANAELWRKTP